MKKFIYLFLNLIYQVTRFLTTILGNLLYYFDKNKFCNFVKNSEELSESDNFREKITDYLVKKNEWSVKRASLDLNLPYQTTAEVGKKLELLGIVEKSKEFNNLRILSIFDKELILKRLYSNFTYKTLKLSTKKLVLEKTIKVGNSYILAGWTYEQLQSKIDECIQNT